MRSWLLDLNLIAQASCSRHQRHFDALLGAQAVALDPGAKALVQRRKVPAAQRVAAFAAQQYADAVAGVRVIDDQAQRLGAGLAQAKSLDGGQAFRRDVEFDFHDALSESGPEGPHGWSGVLPSVVAVLDSDDLVALLRSVADSDLDLAADCGLVRLAGDGLGAGQGLGVGANPVLNAATADDELTVVMDAVAHFYLLPLDPGGAGGQLCCCPWVE